MAEPPTDPKRRDLPAVIAAVIAALVVAGYLGLNAWAAYTAPPEVFRCDDGNTRTC